MNKRLCRYCKDYRPNERHNGYTGWCEKKNAPKFRTETCEDMEEGAQRWMCGEEVKE